MKNKDQKKDFFSRSIADAFLVAGINGVHYTPPRQDPDSSLPDFMRGRRKGNRDPWSEGWHNGFPPPASA